MKISCPKCAQHYEIAGPGTYECVYCGAKIQVPAADTGSRFQETAPRQTAGKPLEYYILQAVAGLLFVLCAMGLIGGVVSISRGMALPGLCSIGAGLLVALFASFFAAAATALNYLREIRNHIVNQ